MASLLPDAATLKKGFGPFFDVYGQMCASEFMTAQGLFPKTKDIDSLFWAHEFNKNPEQVIAAVINQAAINPPEYLTAVSKNINNAMTAEQLTAALARLSTNNLIWAAGALFPDYNEFAHAVYIQRDLPAFLNAAAGYYQSVSAVDQPGADNYAKIIKGYLDKYAPKEWQKTITKEQSLNLLKTIYASDIKKAADADTGTETGSILPILIIAGIGIGGLYFLTRKK